MRKRDKIKALKQERHRAEFAGSTMALIAAVVATVATVGSSVAAAVTGGGEPEVPRNKLTADQTDVAAQLADQFGFGKKGDPLNPNAQLGMGLTQTPGTFLQRAQGLQQRSNLLNPPNTNRFGLGGGSGFGSQPTQGMASKLTTSFGGPK